MSYFRVGRSVIGRSQTAIGATQGLSEPAGTKLDKATRALAGAVLAQDPNSVMRTGHRVSASSSMSSGGFDTSRFAPNLETLDRTSLMDDITPKSEQALMQLFKMIYEKDAVAGPATDLISTIPWSDWSLSGIKDPGIMRLFEDSMEIFDPALSMPKITAEYLMFGRFTGTLLYDRGNGTWKSMIPHDQLYCEYMPIPLHGHDPIVNVTMSPEMKLFLDTKDQRFSLAQNLIPEDMRKKWKKGPLQLEPFSTLFVPRKVTMSDWKGTSIFMRLLPYFAIEKALTQSTIASARRRARSILHLSIGTDQWEPESDEIEAISNMFQQSEEDPVGAIIATRNGINANEIRQGADFWKISEEADYLRNSKMNALGLSDTFLSGEASYSTMEASLSVFMENIKCLRAFMEKRVFEDKLFDIIARANNLTKKKQADLAHGVRTGTATATTVEQQMRIPKRELLIPTIHWTKNLSPESDANYIEILKSLQEQGVPITMKRWASAGGIDLIDLENTLEEDKEIKERFKKYMPKPAPEEGGEGGGDGGGFGAFSNFVDTDAISVLGSFVNHEDHKKHSFFGISYREFRAIAMELTESNRSMRRLRNNEALSSYLNSRFDGNETKIEAAKYMLTRMNLARCVIADDFINKLANKLLVTCSTIKDKKRLGAIKREVEIISVIHEASEAVRTGTARKRVDTKILAKALRDGIIQQNSPQSTYSPHIYTGF